MQRCFDVAVDVKRDENLLKLATFLRHQGTSGIKVIPSMNWTLDKDTQDIGDGIAGVTNINSSVVVCILKQI